MAGVTVDGTDPVVLFPVVEAAVERARRGEGPTFVEALTRRHYGHSFGAVAALPARRRARGGVGQRPVAAFRQWLLDNGVTDEASLASGRRRRSPTRSRTRSRSRKDRTRRRTTSCCVDVFSDVSEVPQ